MRTRSSFRALAAALVATFVIGFAGEASADPPAESEATETAPLLMVTPAQLHSPRVPVAILDARLTDAERREVHLLEGRMRRSAVGANFGGLLFGSSIALAYTAGTTANPWCFDLDLFGERTDGCTPPTVNTREVVGLSIASALSGILGLGLAFGQGARAHGIRAELRAIRDPGLGLRMPDADVSAYRLVFQARF